MLSKEKLKKEIKQMFKADQAERKKKEIDWDKVKKLDLKHSKRVKEIVNRIGWPRISEYGEEMCDSLWLLVQHADHDIEIQKTCLKLMNQLFQENKNEINKSHIAYLTDRIRVKEKNTQKYGTQLFLKNGKWELNEIEDLENLHKMRKKWG